MPWPGQCERPYSNEAASGLKGDFLAGGVGDDVLISGAGADLVSGGSGNDTLVAGGPAGDDTLHGGGGRDILKRQQSHTCCREYPSVDSNRAQDAPWNRLNEWGRF